LPARWARVSPALAAVAVGEGVAGLGLFSFEGTDTGGDVGELDVGVVVAADVGVETPVLGRILDLQCEGIEDLGVPVDGTE
jgi:hypothetical protein